MKKEQLAVQAILSALGVVVYVGLVVLLMTNVERFVKPEESIFGPMLFLLLFVVSASITGLLVFGRPAYLFLNGSKKDAVTLALMTVAALAVCTVLAFILLALWQI